MRKQKKLRAEFRLREDVISKLDTLSRAYTISMTEIIELAIDKLGIVDVIALKRAKDATAVTRKEHASP